MHLSKSIGGWCFYNEGFLNDNDYYTEENKYGENIKMARFVDRGDVTTNIFDDYNSRILEINSKTGLYPLYMAYSMFKTSKEKAFREIQLTGERGTSTDSEGYYRQAGNDLEIWKDVLQDNIFVVCRTKMAVSITKRTLAGFRTDIRMNVKCYEHDVDVNSLVAAKVIKQDDENLKKKIIEAQNGDEKALNEIVKEYKEDLKLDIDEIELNDIYYKQYNIYYFK